MEKLLKPFSLRFIKALAYDKTLKVALVTRTRKRLWSVLSMHDCQTYYHPNPGDSWTENSTWLDDLAGDLKLCHGWDELTVPVKDGHGGVVKTLQDFVIGCYASQVFDLVEIAYRSLGTEERWNLQREINDVLETEDVPWRLSDGELIQLDTHFLTLLTDSAEQGMRVHGFEGALQEFKEARNDLIAGDTKGAVHNACKSMESILQTILKKPDENADRLLKALSDSGFLNDLPENRREGFRQQTMKTLPSMRNAYGGHGQGETPVEIPRVYGDLAVNLAAAFNHFLISKHVASLPPPVPPAPPVVSGEVEDDLPF